MREQAGICNEERSRKRIECKSGRFPELSGTRRPLADVNGCEGGVAHDVVNGAVAECDGKHGAPNQCRNEERTIAIATSHGALMSDCTTRPPATTGRPFDSVPAAIVVRYWSVSTRMAHTSLPKSATKRVLMSAARCKPWGAISCTDAPGAGSWLLPVLPPPATRYSRPSGQSTRTTLGAARRKEQF
jgi:hypothetical protein